MKCLECEGLEFEMDDRMGERVCVQCGFVHVENIFEDTTANYYYDKEGNIHAREIITRRKQLGSDSKLMKDHERQWGRSINYMMALAAEFQPTKLVKDEMAHNYLTLVKAQMFRGVTMDERIGAIIFFTFRENSRSITLKEVAKHCDASPHRLSKISRKIARYFKRPWILSQVNYHGEFERIVLDLGKTREFITDCVNVHLFLEPLCENNNIIMNKAYVGAVIYIVGLLRNERIQQEVLCDIVDTRYVKERYRAIKRLTEANMKILSVEEFVSGVYRK